MTTDGQSFDPPEDTRMPNPLPTEATALSSAEELDEDQLRQDPLEEGMDPPERWSAEGKYGMTGWEQAHPAPLGQRLSEEQPDVDESDAQPTDEAVNSDALIETPAGPDDELGAQPVNEGYGEGDGAAADNDI